MELSHLIKKFLFTTLIILFFSPLIIGQTKDKTIFAYGGQVRAPFVKYVAELTGKEKPKMCFLPTAAGDYERYITYWYELCHNLDVEPHIMRVWVNSSKYNKSFEEIILSMDAIVVGGGNTLNMLAIWEAQGIDTVLHKAYEKGIVLAGGSAGSLCWFNAGSTDSRPTELSIIDCLSFINYSHCPHYNSEKDRRPMYHDNILKGKLSDGYACDDKAGVLFINDKFVKSVSMDSTQHSYFVKKVNNKIIETKLDSEIIK